MENEEIKQSEPETITVAFGEERFAPVQYESFTFGGIYYKECAKKQYIAKRDGFWERHEACHGK